jgi:hypothetical protein
VLGDWPDRVSNALARVEVLRAVRRASLPPRDLRRAKQVLDRLTLLRLDEQILEGASALAPPDLGTLDAIHLATAMTLGRDLVGFVTYDRRLASAATEVGLEVIRPR